MHSDAVPPCTLAAIAAISSTDAEQQDDDDVREFSCEGEDVTVNFVEDDGSIEVKTCVTNGSCEGQWDDYDIEITVQGTACFTVTTD